MGVKGLDSFVQRNLPEITATPAALAEILQGKILLIDFAGECAAVAEIVILRERIHNILYLYLYLFWNCVL